MSQYFFSIRDPQGIIADEEGSDCRNDADALEEATASARDLAKQYIDSRTAFAGSSIEVRDAGGVLLASVAILEVASP
jgi:hypothetical protein